VKLDVIFSQNDIKSKHINTVSHNHTFGLYDLILFLKKTLSVTRVVLPKGIIFSWHYDYYGHMSLGQL